LQYSEIDAPPAANVERTGRLLPVVRDSKEDKTALLPLLEELHTAPKHHEASKFKTVLLAFAVTCLNATGNLSLAWGMKHISAVGVNPLAYVAAMVNPYVAAGIVMLIVWLLTRMALMSWADLSFALPLMAFGYIIAAILGKFVLQEEVRTPQWLGTLFIFAGCALVGTTAHKTHKPSPHDRGDSA